MIAVGLATVKREKKYFDSAREATRFAISKDDGSSLDKFANMIDDMAEGYIKLHVPVKLQDSYGEDLEYLVADYSKASTKSLVIVAGELLKLFRMAYDADMEIAHYNDNPHDAMDHVVEELFDRKENEKVRPIVEKLLKVDFCNFFKEIAGREWNKKLGVNHESAKTARPSKRSHPDEF